MTTKRPRVGECVASADSIHMPTTPATHNFSAALHKGPTSALAHTVCANGQDTCRSIEADDGLNDQLIASRPMTVGIGVDDAALGISSNTKLVMTGPATSDIPNDDSRSVTTRTLFHAAMSANACEVSSADAMDASGNSECCRQSGHASDCGRESVQGGIMDEDSIQGGKDNGFSAGDGQASSRPWNAGVGTTSIGGVSEAASTPAGPLPMLASACPGMQLLHYLFSLLYFLNSLLPVQCVCCHLAVVQ